MSLLDSEFPHLAIAAFFALAFIGFCASYLLTSWVLNLRHSKDKVVGLTIINKDGTKSSENLTLKWDDPNDAELIARLTKLYKDAED